MKFISTQPVLLGAGWLKSAILGLALSCSASAQKQSPNIVLILADDLGYGGIQGKHSSFLETPHISKLAATGYQFEQSLSPYPTCKPSLAAILMGQYGPRTGVYRVSNKHLGFEKHIRWTVPTSATIPKQGTTIAEALSEKGYRCAMYGKWHVDNNGSGHPLNHGFHQAIVSTGHYKADFIVCSREWEKNPRL